MLLWSGETGMIVAVGVILLRKPRHGRRKRPLLRWRGFSEWRRLARHRHTLKLLNEMKNSTTQIGAEKRRWRQEAVKRWQSEWDELEPPEPVKSVSISSGQNWLSHEEWEYQKDMAMITELRRRAKRRR